MARGFRASTKKEESVPEKNVGGLGDNKKIEIEKKIPSPII